MNNLKEKKSTNTGTINIIRSEPYVTYPPFEWNWRSVSQVPFISGEFNEKLNVITQVNRAKVEIGLYDKITFSDRILLSLDLNTSHENAEYRFDINLITAFYQKISAFHDDLVTKITEFING